MDLVVMGGKSRLLVKAKRSRREISQRSRDEFILSLSETCNVSLSAERAGVALSTVYKMRQRDAAFAAAWLRALDDGYQRLEMGLVQAALAAVEGPPADTGASGEARNRPVVEPMTMDQALRLGAASAAIAAHNAAAVWNRALLDNAARPSGALVHDPGDKGMPLSAEQVDRLREELATSFAGGANAGRPLLLEGGLRWQALSLSPAEMDFLALKDSSAREIAMAFGVPPMLLGLPGDATYANYREANRALWRLTVLPLCAKILGAISQGLAGWFDGAELRVDLDKVPALAEDRMALWREVSAADWLSADEKKALLSVD